jgi:hypothetical protein
VSPDLITKRRNAWLSTRSPLRSSRTATGRHLRPLGSEPAVGAILNGATAKDVTYGLTADGFAYSVSQASVDDKRLTLVQDLSRPGKTTETLTIKYVDSTDATRLRSCSRPA